MNKFFFLLLLFPIGGFAQTGAEPHIHYSIYATLNSDDKTVTAFEKIKFTNTFSEPLNYVWIRLYPNTYANDRTAYSEYMLNKGDLRFYFSKEEEKGYINQLDFKQNDVELKTEFDSAKNDVIKVYLSNPLQTGDSAEITTPFFVKIPYDFSGFGYNDDDEIELTHWFPELAYQDENGWDLKAFTSYHNFRINAANFDVKFILDKNNYQSNATVINNISQDNKTITQYQSNDEKDFLLSNAKISSGGKDAAALEFLIEDDFEKLVPNFFDRKRAVNSQLTQLLINQKIHGNDSSLNKTLKPAFLFNLRNTNKYNYISFLPAVGFNDYDKTMLGIMIHNYQLPLNKFNFLFAPMYATGSKSFAGAGRLEYNIWDKNSWWQFSVSGEQYSMDKYQLNFEDGTSSEKYLKLRRIAPSVSYTKYLDDYRNQKLNFRLRTFFLHQDTVGGYENPFENTAIVEFQANYRNDRALYPYNASLKADGDKDFLRLDFTGNYFLNYDASGKGLNVRLFASKFFYLNNDAKYGFKNIYMSQYFPTLSGASGGDYTYSNYFIGRNEITGWMSQQIAQNQGFFKVITPALVGTSVGISDNWVAALNFTADIPDNINPFSRLPFKMPLRVFLDAGTYSEAWSDNAGAPSGKYLYDAGLQVSFFRDALNIYLPFLYSKSIRDNYKNAYPAKTFVHTISFSINLENLKPKVLNKILPL